MDSGAIEQDVMAAQTAAMVRAQAQAEFGISLGQPFRCRACEAPLSVTLADLGASPIANDYIEPDRYFEAEPVYPLRALVCSECWLVQTADVVRADRLFRADYAYFSSNSASWLRHAEAYVSAMIARFGLGGQSRVVEIASNDGYLLQYVQAAGLRCLGVEPTLGPAEVARAKGLETRVGFFGRESAQALLQEGWAADLMPANNVFAHVPDIHDFLAGFAILLAPEGVATFEVQHLLRLMQRRQFDTLYHEHFSYWSLLAAERALAQHGLRVFDVEELPTHGGSFRLFVCRDEASHASAPALERIRAEEQAYGLYRAETYQHWGAAICGLKLDLLQLLIDLKRQGARIAAYGAPAKGNTLLNFCGIGREFIEFTVDREPRKQNRFLPGSRIPVLPVETIQQARPDYLLILPWNLREEIMAQEAGIRAWGGRFIIPGPEPHIVEPDKLA